MNKNMKTTMLMALLAALTLIPAALFQGCGSEPFEVVELPPPPAGTPIVINNGASTVYVTTVKLKLHADDADGVAAYYVSEDPTPPAVGAAGWELIAGAPTSYDGADDDFVLSAEYGTKTVYVWFKDTKDNISEAASDTINYSQQSGPTS